MQKTGFFLVALCVAGMAESRVVLAKANGFAADSCTGCHRGGPDFKPKISADPAQIEPGGSTTLTITVARPAAGLFLGSGNKGVFTELPGEGLKKVGDTVVTHTSPKRANGNEVTFKVKWTAPADMGPGGVDFDVTALGADGDGSSRGDAEGSARLNLSFGCEGVDVYLDQDGDGFGLTDPRGPTRRCKLEAGWTMKPGDCNDYDKNANPMGTEVCNLYDDDCDGMINEGLDGATVYRDMDGDGHGSRFTAEMRVGCPAGGGWSSLRDDCDDMDRMVNPRAKETCNYKDDNCNGRMDENARASCGTGWCRREAASCDAMASCTPNPPRAEQCNLFDDDCDGVIDNGASCPNGNVCYKGVCLTAEAAGEMAAAEPPPPPDAGAGPTGAGGIPGGPLTPANGSTSGSSGAGGSGAGVPGSTAGGEEPASSLLGCRVGAPGGSSSEDPSGLLVLAGLIGLGFVVGRLGRRGR